MVSVFCGVGVGVETRAAVEGKRRTSTAAPPVRRAIGSLRPLVSWTNAKITTPSITITMAGVMRRFIHVRSGGGAGSRATGGADGVARMVAPALLGRVGDGGPPRTSSAGGMPRSPPPGAPGEAGGAAGVSGPSGAAGPGAPGARGGVVGMRPMPRPTTGATGSTGMMAGAGGLGAAPGKPPDIGVIAAPG